MNQWLKLIGCVGAVLTSKIVEALAQREINKVLSEGIIKSRQHTKLK